MVTQDFHTEGFGGEGVRGGVGSLVGRWLRSCAEDTLHSKQGLHGLCTFTWSNLWWGMVLATCEGAKGSAPSLSWCCREGPSFLINTNRCLFNGKYTTYSLSAIQPFLS